MALPRRTNGGDRATDAASRRSEATTRAAAGTATSLAHVTAAQVTDGAHATPWNACVAEGSTTEQRRKVSSERARGAAEKLDMCGLPAAPRSCRRALEAIETTDYVDGIPIHVMGSRFRKWSLPVAPSAKVALADTLEAAPSAQDTYCKNMEARVELLHSWGMERVLQEGVPVVVQMARIKDAVKRKRGGRETSSGLPSEATLRSMVWTESLPTLVASGGSHFMVVTLRGGVLEARMASPGECATWMEVPANHRVRRGLRAVRPCAARALCGQAAVVSSTAAVLTEGLRLSGLHGKLTLGVAGSGVALVAVAMDDVLGANWSYAFFAEHDKTAIAAHHAAWSHLAPKHFGSTHLDADVAAMPSVDIWQWSPPCEPFSSGNRAPPASVEPALAKMRASLRYPARAQPRLILIEETDALAKAHLEEIRMRLETMLAGLGEHYGWLMIIESPAQHAAALQDRKRLWYIGYRRD